MADQLWAEMARKDGIRRKAPATWTAERPTRFKPLQEGGAFCGMATPAVRGMLDELMGAGRWTEPPHWGQPLVCFPTVHRWAIPEKNWHLDLPADPRRFAHLMGRFFLLLAPLAPRGGGTLVATGSHRLVAKVADRADVQLSSSDIRKRLKTEHRWFHDLMAPPREGEDRTARFLGPETLVDGVACSVEEIVGDAGDVFLMHPAALHTLSPNALDQPRLALAQVIYPKSWFGRA
jgi:hypothetical protein